MKLIILTLLLVAIGTGYCEDIKFTKLLAAEKAYLVELEARHVSEINCIKKIDAALVSRWNIEEKKIPINDLGEIPEVHRRSLDSIPSTNNLYNTELEEWLIDNDILPSKRIETCLLGLKEDILPLVPVDDIKCLDDLMKSHIATEVKLENEFVELIKNLNSDQILFRKFWNFHEYVEMMFQNRSFDGLSGVEEDVYKHMESYLPTKEDKDRKVFAMHQECPWERFRALQEAPSSESKFEEFKSQVRHLVNLKLSRSILPMSYITIHNMTLVIEKHTEWLQSREKTMVELNEEIEKLKTEEKDIYSLCVYAERLASNIFSQQSSILKSKYAPSFTLDISETALRINKTGEILKNRNDERQSSIQTLSTNIKNDWTCLEGFAKLVINHRNIAIISALTDSRHSYQEISCADYTTGPTLGIFNRYCNCIGSSCTTNGLYGPHSFDYEIVRGNDGVYKIIPSSHLIFVLELERNSTMTNSSTKVEERH